VGGENLFSSATRWVSRGRAEGAGEKQKKLKINNKQTTKKNKKIIFFPHVEGAEGGNSIFSPQRLGAAWGKKLHLRRR